MARGSQLPRRRALPALHYLTAFAGVPRPVQDTPPPAVAPTRSFGRRRLPGYRSAKAKRRALVSDQRLWCRQEGVDQGVRVETNGFRQI